MAKTKLQLLADELEQVMDLRTRIEGELDPIKEKENAIRAEIVQGLLKSGFEWIRTTSGMGFGIVQGRKTFTVKRGKEQDAIAWVKEEYPGLLMINKADLAKVLKPMLKVPDFFEEKVGEPHLSVRSQEE